RDTERIHGILSSRSPVTYACRLNVAPPTRVNRHQPYRPPGPPRIAECQGGAPPLALISGQGTFEGARAMTRTIAILGAAAALLSGPAFTQSWHDPSVTTVC